MGMLLLDTENGNYDLTSLVSVLTHTVSGHTQCQVRVDLGDGVDDLSGAGGSFELVLTVGGQVVQPSPQVVSFSSAARAVVWSTPTPVADGDELVVQVKSPNSADADVDVTARLFDVAPVGVDANGRVQIEGVKTQLDDLNDVAAGDEMALTSATLTSVAAAVWDRLTSALTVVGSIGAKLANWTLGADNGVLLSDEESLYYVEFARVRDNDRAADLFEATWYKNGEPLASGVSDAALTVVEVLDGLTNTTKVDDQAMTEVGTSHAFVYEATGAERPANGRLLICDFTATIDGAARTCRRLDTRDNP